MNIVLLLYSKIDTHRVETIYYAGYCGCADHYTVIHEFSKFIRALLH